MPEQHADSALPDADCAERPATFKPFAGVVHATIVYTKSTFGPKDFLRANSIRHATSAPFHPSTNGLAERNVRTTKDALKRIIRGDWHQRLADFLLTQHTTPCTATGKSPAEMRWGKRLTTKLDRLHPDKLPSSAEPDIPNRSFKIGDLVWARNYGQGDKWVPGVVTDIMGPLSYTIEGEGNRISKRHIDQLRKRVAGSMPVDGGQNVHGGDTASWLNQNNLPVSGEAEIQTSVTTANPQHCQIDWELSPMNRPAVPEQQQQTQLQSQSVSRESSEPVIQNSRPINISQPIRQSVNNDLSNQTNRYPSRVHRPPKYLRDYVKK
ncbi:uncharacterized protein M6D78_005826 [Vipera latastei]